MPGFRMPPVEAGDPVLWYTDGDPNTEPTPAVVTRVGAETVCLSRFAPDQRTASPVEGVYHISDPRCRGEYTRDAGGWDYAPLMKRLMALESSRKK